MPKVYSWKGKRNFGDALTGFILDHLGVQHEWAPPEDADLVAVGSVLEHLPSGWSGTVAGAGILRPNARVDLTSAKVVGLRGKLTRKTAKLPKGARPVLGDPGLLVSAFVRQGPARHDLGVVPHWSDKQLAKRFPYGHVIDVSKPPAEVIADIASCKRIISSSLHGLIVADAYGIPRQAEKFPFIGREGGDFKFRDYASVFDGDPHFGHMWRAPHADVERIQRELRATLGELLNRPAPAEAPASNPPPRRHSPWWRRPQISLLVPFRDDHEHRTRVWAWLRQYWEANLDSVEIVMGHDSGYPFSKATAVNEAASRARGRTFVILDADAYLDAQELQGLADRLDAARKASERQWFMPYNRLYRLNRPFTLDLLDTDPTLPYQIPSPPPAEDLDSKLDAASYGHRYGAMMQVMPREAFFHVGGMDPRFRGWGSEDASFLRALDTLWGHHEVATNDIAHLWHSRPGNGTATNARHWVGQDATLGPPNSRLAQRHSQATGEPGAMRAIANEREQPKPRKRWQ